MRAVRRKGRRRPAHMRRSPSEPRRFAAPAPYVGAAPPAGAFAEPQSLRTPPFHDACAIRGGAPPAGVFAEPGCSEPRRFAAPAPCAGVVALPAGVFAEPVPSAFRRQTFAAAPR